MSLAVAAPPVAGLAETGSFLQGGDAACVFGFEFGETGAVVFFFGGALCFLFFDLVVGEDADGEEEGCHCGESRGSCLNVAEADSSTAYIEVKRSSSWDKEMVLFQSILFFKIILCDSYSLWRSQLT